MNIDCSKRERIFEDGTAEEWAALESHAAACTACAEEIRSWRALSVAAQELRDDSESPALWSRIASALAQEAARNSRSKKAWGWFSPWKFAPFGWPTIAAGAFVLFLAVFGNWLISNRPDNSGSAQHSSLLRSKALNEVERTESAYIRAIDKLAAEAKPQLDNPATPLLTSYREKLLLIDSAIDDLRAQAGENRSNAHLRFQLLTMYQEKQRTLEEILEEKR